MSNRVDDLETKVSELQAAVNGLTEELVETKERVRQLENAVDVDDPLSRAKQPGERTAETATTSATDDADAATEADSADSADETDAEPEQRFVDAEEHEQELQAETETDEEAKSTEEKEDEKESEQEESDIIVA